MPPSANTSNTPPMRQSCDRCHRQKLRCTRTSNAGVCNRCLRKRVECVYSSCLPKGRPSLYKTTDEAAAPEPETGLVTPESLTGADRSPRLGNVTGSGGVNVDDAAAAENGLASDVTTGMNVDVETREAACNDGGNFVDSNLRLNDNTSINMEMNKGIFSDLMSIPTNMPSESWPNLQAFMGFDGPLDWGDSSPTPDWQGMFDSQVDHETPLITGFPGMYTQDMGGCDSGLISPEHLVTGNAHTLPVESSLENHPGSDDIYHYDHSIDIIIMKLFHLSMRLGQLRRSSYALAKTIESSSSPPSSCSSSSFSPSKDHSTQDYQFRLLDDAAFKSVATWLHEAGGTSKPKEDDDNHQSLGTSDAKGGLLHDVLSASHQLLEILMDGISSLPATPATAPSLSAFSSSSSLATQLSSASDSLYTSFSGSGSSSSSRSSQRSNNNIIRHLVIACHTMLLTIHVAILAALQHDADQPVISPLGTAALGQIRLVSVVQLCAYVIERQNRAVDSYLSVIQQQQQQRPVRHDNGQSWRLKKRQCDHGGNDPLQTLPSSTLVPEDEDAIRDLTNEVQQRLLRLQQTLRIC